MDVDPLTKLKANLETEMAERERAEEALRKSEERFRLAAEAVHGHVYDWDVGSGSVFRTPGLVRVIGLPPDQAQPTRAWWLDRVHPDDRPRLDNTIREAFGNQSTGFCLAYRMRDRDGAYVWVRDQGCIVRDTAGKAVRVVGTGVNITERKQAEQLLREQKAALQSVQERLVAALWASSTGTYRWDIRNDAIDSDEPLERLFGLPAERTLSHLRDFFALVYPDDLPAVKERCRRCAVEGIDFAMEYRVVWPNGNVRWLDDRGKTTFDDAGRPLYVTGACVDITDRKTAELALRQSEAFMRGVFESSADCIMILDPQGRLLEMNGPGRRLMAVTDFEAVRGRDWLWLWQGQIREAARAAVQTAQANGVGRFQAARVTDTDLVQYFDVVVTAVHDGERRLPRLAAVARDVSETQHAEEALLLRDRALAAASNGIIIADARKPQQPIVYVNQGFQAMTGYSTEEMLGRNCRMLQGPGTDPAARAEMRAAIEAGDGCRTEILNYRKDGQPFWNEVAITPVHDDSGSLTHFIGVLTDVGQRRRTEQALRHNEARFRSLAESGPQMIWLADAKGDYEYVNRKWMEYTGLTLEQTRRPAEFRTTLHPEEQPPLPERLAAAYARGEPFSAEVRLRRAGNGTFRWFLVRAEPVMNDHGHITQWIGALTDIEDQKQAEIALLEADRGKDEFLAMLAHELRNPLAPIRNAVQMLHFMEGGEQLRWVQDVIDRQVKHLSRLVDDLLDVSRITRGKIQLQKQPVSLAEVVAQAIETSRPLIEARQHTLEVHEPEEPVRVLGDSTRLAQVVLNLLNNAAKYTEEGGRIALTVESTEQEAVIRVRDNGLGIPREMLPRIFDLFTQVDRTLDRAQGGLGIGLMLVRRLVQMHGGRVTAASEGPGKGSEFTVRLPLLAEAGEEDASESAPAAGRSGQRRRILVVDDNKDSADSLTMLLRLAGHEVMTAYDGQAGLDAARRWKPDVMLLDIGLPRLDGYELARRLRQEQGLADALIIAMTGYGKDEDRKRSQEAGFNAHLVKPVDLDELGRIITAFAGQPV